MILFVRHGQTQDNVNKINTGRNDIPLNDVGFSQARNCAEIMKKSKIDVVYCSPLLRAKQTAIEIIKFHKDVPLIFDDRLLEREDGAATGMKQCDAYCGSAWDFKKLYDFENFEKLDKMFERISDFYDDILEKYKDKVVLIVAHDGVGKMSRMYFEGLPDCKNLDSFKFDNAKPYVLCKD